MFLMSSGHDSTGRNYLPRTPFFAADHGDVDVSPKYIFELSGIEAVTTNAQNNAGTRSTIQRADMVRA